MPELVGVSNSNSSGSKALDGATGRVSCRLLPLSQFFIILFILVALSVLSNLFWGGQFSLLSFFCTLVVIPLIVAATLRLELDFSSKGIKAANQLHSDMLYMRSVRPWADLHSVRLRGVAKNRLMERLFSGQRRLAPKTWRERVLTFLGQGWFRQGFIVFDFKSGGMVAFPLAGFDSVNIERLFLILSRYADPISLNADVIALQRDILTGGEVKSNLSYTQMWEDSLAERFEVTNFVPLLCGQSIRDETLTVLMQLNCGGMSSVYLVRDTDGKRLVLKELAVQLDRDADENAKKLQELFSREASLLSKLSHPGIVQVQDHFVERGRHYLLLEFVAGLSLRQHVKLKGPFNQREVLEIAEQLASVLIYLHGFSPPVVHRDITPDNIIIREKDRKITLVDFGAANEFVGNLTGTLIGKQCYIPPEQFQGRACLKSDIFAFGGTLFYLLTGKDPEPISTSRVSEVDKQLVSAQFDDLIAAMTCIEPESRPSAEELALALSSIAKGGIQFQ